MNYRDWLEQQADRRLDEASFAAAARGQEMQAKAGRQARTAFLHAAAKFDSAPSAIAREIIEANPNLGADIMTLQGRGVDPIEGDLPDFNESIDSFAGKVLLQYLARRNTYSSTFGAPSLAAETECMRRAILAVLTP